MQSCAVSSSVSLMFQKGSGVENKYLYSDLPKKKGRKKKERKENLMQRRKVELYCLSTRSEELYSDVSEKLCMMKDLKL